MAISIVLYNKDHYVSEHLRLLLSEDAKHIRCSASLRKRKRLTTALNMRSGSNACSLRSRC